MEWVGLSMPAAMADWQQTTLGGETLFILVFFSTLYKIVESGQIAVKTRWGFSKIWLSGSRFVAIMIDTKPAGNFQQYSLSIFQNSVESAGIYLVCCGLKRYRGRNATVKECLRSQRWCQSSEQNRDHANIEESFASLRHPLIIFTQAPAPVQPSESTPNQPSLRQHPKALAGLRAQQGFDNPTIGIHHKGA